MQTNGEYCIYLRKSRADLEAESRGEGETLAKHRKALLSLARKMNVNITEIYSEIVSGESILDRPVVQQVLREVEDGRWRGVLVMEVERLARGDTIDQGIVARAFSMESTLIVTPQKTYDPNNEFDQEYFEFGLFMSRREYKTINRRLQSGRIASVKEGNYIGNTPPYGYLKKLLEDGAHTLEPHPEQSEIVKLVFEWYTLGAIQEDGSIQRLGTGLIAKKLNNLSIPTTKNSIWTVATINGMIRNPVYAGMIRWNGRSIVKKKSAEGIVKSRPRAKQEDWILVPGKHKALVSQAVFDKAQDIMKSNSHVRAPAGKVTNPLAGLIQCGKCGRAMIYRSYNRDIAPHIMCSNQMCDNKSAKFTHVENKILEGLSDWISRYKAKWGNKKKETRTVDVVEIKRTALAAQEKERLTLEKQKGKLHDLLEQGVYDMPTFLERSQVLAERLSENEQSILALQAEIDLEGQRAQAQQDIIPTVENVLSLYHKTESKYEQNQLLKSVLQQSVYIKEKHQKEDDFLLTLYPKLPR